MQRIYTSSLVLATLVLVQQGLGIPAPQVTGYGQCGGVGYNGGTSCDAGYTCSSVNPYYSQCTPTPIPVGDQEPYGQCGGTGYNGLTKCSPGYQCEYVNAYYSQCLPGSVSSSTTIVSSSKSSSSSVKSTASTSTRVPSSTAISSVVTTSMTSSLPTSTTSASASFAFSGFSAVSSVSNQVALTKTEGSVAAVTAGPAVLSGILPDNPSASPTAGLQPLTQKTLLYGTKNNDGSMFLASVGTVAFPGYPVINYDEFSPLVTSMQCSSATNVTEIAVTFNSLQNYALAVSQWVGQNFILFAVGPCDGSGVRQAFIVNGATPNNGTSTITLAVAQGTVQSSVQSLDISYGNIFPPAATQKRDSFTDFFSGLWSDLITGITAYSNVNGFLPLVIMEEANMNFLPESGENNFNCIQSSWSGNFTLTGSMSIDNAGSPATTFDVETDSGGPFTIAGMGVTITSSDISATVEFSLGTNNGGLSLAATEYELMKFEVEPYIIGDVATINYNLTVMGDLELAMNTTDSIDLTNLGMTMDIPATTLTFDTFNYGSSTSGSWMPSSVEPMTPQLSNNDVISVTAAIYPRVEFNGVTHEGESRDGYVDVKMPMLQAQFSPASTTCGSTTADFGTTLGLAWDVDVEGFAIEGLPAYNIWTSGEPVVFVEKCSPQSI